jgi:type II secretory pathway component GspD/PulD (secretin)
MPPGGPSPGPKPEGVAQTSPAAANPSSDGPAATPLTTVTVGGGAPAVITSFPFPTGIPTPQSSESYRLRFLDPDAAWALLDGLFPAAYAGRLVNFARQPERNGIFLSGTEDGVRQAAQILARADREQPTILLEALVIQFDTEAFEQLNMSLQNFQRRAISGLTTQIGEANGAALLFTHAPGIANPQIYTAIINALFQVDKARLVARPFVSTLSGKTALIDISGSRYVVVQQVQAGAAVIGTQAINSGVTMNITPTAVADGMIRVSLDILDSQFVPTSGNVAVAVAKHAVRSQVQIHDGQTIIIGGMTLLSRTNSNAGLPFLRLIPGLNLLFANQSATQRNQEVAIYVTPHIVEPGMNPSMISPEALSVPKNWKEQTVTPWEKLP